MLVELLKNEKHQLQEELQKYKEMQRNLEVKASELTIVYRQHGCWLRILTKVYVGGKFEMLVTYFKHLAANF